MSYYGVLLLALLSGLRKAIHYRKRKQAVDREFCLNQKLLFPSTAVTPNSSVIPRTAMA